MNKLRRLVYFYCSLQLVAASGFPTAAVVAQTINPAAAGPWAVGHIRFDAVDGSRNDRLLAVDAWYPVDAEDVSGENTLYPLAEGLNIASELAFDNLPVSALQYRHLLVFSHGFGGTNTQSVPLMETLASHGFIVVSPEHTGNTNDADPQLSAEQAAMDRVPDVSFIIDHMVARARDETDAFFTRIHPTRVGVLGHSFGGTTAMGMELGFGGGEPDPRVVAIQPISGDIAVETYTEQDLANVNVPVLLVGGTEDASVPIALNARAFTHITGRQPVYQLDLLGATHTHFANICAIADTLIAGGITPAIWPSIGAEALIEPYNQTCTEDAFPIDDAVRLQNLYTVAFFKTHLAGDLRYAAFLTRSYAADNEPLVDFFKKVRLPTLARFKFW
ncbi:MAG: alpha/beta hydrolase family protein [Pseudomonadales bacterium]